MWTIIELISKNPEISLSSRNNPEMSQCSSDVPIVVKFSVYISLRCSLNWVVSFKIYVSPLSIMLFPISEFFEKSQMSEFFDVSAGCRRVFNMNLLNSVKKIFVITVKGLNLASLPPLCVRDQDATTVPARHI